MSVVCAECGATENVKVVCHHCGKPLCDDHCMWIFDGAFSDDPALSPTGPQDGGRSHFGLFTQIGAQIRRRLVLWGLLATSQVDAMHVAYHCEACYTDHHPWVLSMKGSKLP